MANSPSHRFGQIVGELLEEILLPELLSFCAGKNLYVDRHGARQGVRAGKKVSWEDRYGNSHDLDFVIEKNGSATKQGRPVAFIEAAWRRYTKHSRAKAQEIQGAVLPIAEKYELDAPFLGAVLAGIFTAPSVTQLKSLGFEIVYLPYETIVHAFSVSGIDARFDESTPDEDFSVCVANIEGLPKAKRDLVKAAILDANKSEFENFFVKLRRKLDRSIERVMVLPLFGNPITFETVAEASSFIDNFDCQAASGDFRKYEVSITFSNADEVRGIFSKKEEAVRFMRYVTS